MEDHQQLQTMEREALLKPGEGFDRQVLEKVILALEARLSEHVGQVERHLAEMDAQVALDLKAVVDHTISQNGSFEKAVQQIESEVSAALETARQQNARQLFGVDQKIVELQDALPAKFREIVEAVRSAMEARLALGLTELEGRATSPEQLRGVETRVRAEIEALAGKFTAELGALAELHQSQAAPLQQAVQQLEGKLTALREELPPKIRQIVEAVEAAVDARIATGDSALAGQVAQVEQQIAGLRELAAGSQPAAERAEQALAGMQVLERRLAVLLDEIRGIDERQRTLIEQVRADLRAAQEQFQADLAGYPTATALEQGLAELQEALAAVNRRLDAGESQAAGQVSSLEQQAAQVSALDERLTRLHDELPPKFKAIVDAVMESMDARIAAETRAVEERHGGQIEELAADLRAARDELRQIAERAAGLEQQAALVTALDRKLTALQEELPPKFQAIVDAVRDALDARVAAEVGALEKQHTARIEQLEAGLLTTQAELQPRLQAVVDTVQDALETRMAAALKGAEEQHGASIRELAETVQGRLAGEIQALEARARPGATELEKALQYSALLEARIQALEQKLQQIVEESVDRDAERIWQAIEKRLRERNAQPVRAVESLGELRQRSTSAEQSVLNLIAGIGSLFEKPSQPGAAPPPQEEVTRVVEPPAAAVETAPVMAVPPAAEPERTPIAEPVAGPKEDPPAPPPPLVPINDAPPPPPKSSAAPQAKASTVVVLEPPAAREEPVAASTEAEVMETEEPPLSEQETGDKPPVILFKPKDAGRKWRIPFVSSFFVLATALLWTQQLH